MPGLPRLLPLNPKLPDGTDSVVFAVFAPFGSDPLLSSYPDNVQQPIDKQPLVRSLKQVAKCGVHVSALIDLYGDDSYLVEIPAGQPGRMQVFSTWKQDMSSPRSLAGFLRRTHACQPCSALVLAIEGHGAGYLPELDATKFAPGAGGGSVTWKISDDTVEGSRGGAPLLGFGYPELPVPGVDLPSMRPPISTWGLGDALRLTKAAKVPRPAVIHFDNCFNMSVEVLHTLRDLADYATSYCNYNFYSAGAAYPRVFGHLRQAGTATREQLAKWFALENQRALSSPPFFPTIGGAVRLREMTRIGAAIDELATVLVGAITGAGAGRQIVIDEIKQAIVRSQQYDTLPGFELEVPDQLTDVASFANALRTFSKADVANKAASLLSLLGGIKVYGDDLNPSVDTGVRWNFTSKALAMNILLPDPARQGRWDWRSPYYGPPRQGGPDFQHQHIDFLADRPGGATSPWLLFLDEYHKDVPFVALLRARPLFFPRFDAKFDPKGSPSGPTKPGGPNPPPSPPPTPRQTAAAPSTPGLTRAVVPPMPMGPRRTDPGSSSQG